MGTSNHLSVALDLSREIFFEEVTNLDLLRDFPNIQNQWNHYIESLLIGEGELEEPETFKKLHRYVIGYIQAEEQRITRQTIRNFLSKESLVFQNMLAGSRAQFSPQNEEDSINKLLILQAKSQRALVTSMDHQYHIIRDMMTNPHKFSNLDGEEGEMEYRRTDKNGNTKLLARIKNDDQEWFVENWTGEEQQQWKRLRNVLSSMDEMTADVFDVICFLFLHAPRDENGYIYLNSYDVFKLRKVESVMDHDSTELQVKERDRLNIMSRVKAIANIWVNLNEGSAVQIESESGEALDLYAFEKLLDIGRVYVAYNKKGKMVGIQACQIKPTPLFSKILLETKRLGVLDLSALEFHPIREKYEKRLTRYLTIQWFIRSVGRKVTSPFKVSTLVEEMQLEHGGFRGVGFIDRFVETLENLQKHHILKEWEFIDGLDYDIVKKRNWRERFLEKRIKLMPAEGIINKNKVKLSILKEQSAIGTEELEQELLSIIQSRYVGYEGMAVEEEIVLQQEEQQANLGEISKKQEIYMEEVPTPEMVLQEMERRSLSALRTSEEVQLPYTTFKRFIGKETKRRNKNNDAKISAWYKQSCRISL